MNDTPADPAFDSETTHAKLKAQDAFHSDDTPVDWTNALIICGAGTVDPMRPTIVAESRADDGSLATPTYPTGAALYLASGIGADSATFPGGSTVLALGRDLEQGLFSGFSSVPGIVHVGPAHPVYAAANVAWQNGATAIEIKGLSAYWKPVVQAWIDQLPTDDVAPASNVTITLT